MLLHALPQPLLEGKQTVVLPGSDTVIPVHPNFRFFAAQNDAAYGGRKQLPVSLRARFLQTQVPAFTHGELKAIVLKRFQPFLGVGTEDAIAGALAQVRLLDRARRSVGPLSVDVQQCTCGFCVAADGLASRLLFLSLLLDRCANW